MTRSRLLIVSLLTLVAAAVAVPTIQAAPSCTIGWTGAAGTDVWGTAGNWNENRLPGTADHVCLDKVGGGTVVLSGDANVQSVQGAMTLQLNTGTLTISDTGGEAVLSRFAQSSGTLAGAGTLRIGSLFEWTGGWHVNGGLLQVDGDTQIDGSVAMDVGRRLQTNTATWHSGTITGRNGVVWTSTGTLDLRSEAGSMSFQNWTSSLLPQIRNTGTVTKSAGTGTTTVGWAIDNENVVTVASGALEFGGGAYENAGHFESPGGELVFTAGTFTMGAGTYDGLEFSGGRFDVPTDGTFSGTDLKISGGTLGGAGTLLSSRLLELSGGWFDGTGLTKSTGTTQIAGSIGFDVGRRLQTHDGEWTTGGITGRNSVVWTNTGVFDMRAEVGSASFQNWNSNAHPRIHNTGTILRTSGEGDTTVGWAIENDGKVDARAGRLQFTLGGGESNGDFTSTAPGRTVLAAGDFTAGEGTYGGFEISGGRLDIAAGATYSGGDLWQSGGTIGGAGTLATSGTFTWTGGWQSHGGLTRSTGTTRIDGSVGLEVGRRLQTHDGEWGTGSITARNDVVWTNTGVFDLRSETGSASYQNWNSAAHPRIHNTGTLLKSAGDGDTTIGLRMENDGVVHVASGRLRFIAGGDEGSGDFEGAGTGRPVLGGGDFSVTNGAFDDLEVAGGRLVVADGATFSGVDLHQSGGEIAGAGTLVTSGTFAWSGGWMDGPGTTRSTGTTNITGSVGLHLGRSLETTDGSWTAGSIVLRNRSRWTNTGAFAMSSESGDLYHQNWNSSGGPEFRNTGTITRADLETVEGPEDLHISMPADNDGSITSQSGRILLNSGGLGTSTGVFGASLNGGTFRFGPGASFAPGGELLSGATVELVDGTVVELAGGRIAGNITGTGDLRIPSGEVFWSGGRIGGAGLLHVAEGATMTIDGSSHELTGRRLLQSEGDIRWTAGSIYVTDAATLLNEGTMEILTEGTPASTSGLGPNGRASLINTGTVIKSTGTGTAWMDQLQNEGLLDIRAGIVSSTGFRQSAGGRILATLGGTIRGTEHAGLNLADAKLAGKLAVRLAEGYTPADGAKFVILGAGNYWEDWGALTPETLTLPDGGSISGAVVSDNYTYTASVPAAQRVHHAEPVATAEPAPAPDAPAPAEPATADAAVRLAPGQATAIAVPKGSRVKMLTRTKRATVRFDKKARRLRVKLRRKAWGARLRLRYRLIAADGRRSKVTTLTVRIARARR